MNPRPRVTHHWRQRVLERIGQHVDPEALFRRIAKSIRAGDDEFARFKATLKLHGGRKIYRFEIEEGVFFAVVDGLTAVTLLTPNVAPKRSAKAKPKRLAAPGWTTGSKKGRCFRKPA